MIKYCSNCGAELKENSRLCSECGQQIDFEASSYNIEADVERVLFALSNARKPKSFGRHDDYCIAITHQRMIMARVISDMLKDAEKEARHEAKGEGKGFFRRIGSQLRAYMNFGDRYIGKLPEEILDENSENFDINNKSINRILVTKKSRGEDSDYYEFNIKTSSGNHKFVFESFLPKNFNDLKAIYGDRVKTKGWFKLF
jgi:hypothetical protein